MKHFKYVITLLMAAFLLVACEDGIDSLTEVDPGADETAPSITITSPTEGLAVKVNEELATITIKFEAKDDIELASVQVALDGTILKTYSNFLDYRRLVVDDLVYDQLADGNHVLTVTATDLEGKTTNDTVNFTKEPAYVVKYPGEILYMPFDGAYVDLISFEEAQEFGSPSISEDNIAGDGSYQGATDTYLTLDPERFKNAEFSAIFWMKINSTPDRAGVLTMSPPLVDGTNNDLTKGFRFFRENTNGNQRFKLNVGSGDAGTWFDGGEAADVDPSTGEWVNFAFTISGAKAVVYIDGQIASEGAFNGIDWTDVNVLSIMSGAPNFTQWNHWSDESLMDELRIFNRAISQEEI
ncbi:LamG-like jellyroll fold domain-containing protein [Maribacter sp. MAR_2009_72]|uniref:LamG-like jellyroll fold domain-containing protein n=1 Tax=Maribacter sp. MAR_2009_72 TaxID=1250050 RepID=UPI0021BDEB84|nr:LamG-like jellyroll fold domain-containing protein [Maribacter sp. MAR_2009_72]